MRKKVIIVFLIITCFIIASIFLFFSNNKSNDKISIKEENYEYFILYSLDGKFGVVNKDGKKIIETKYNNIYIPNQSKDVFICTSDDKNIVLDKNGKELFNKYDDITCINIYESDDEIEKDVLKYKKDDKYGLIDLSGKILTDAIYQEIYGLNNKPGSILVLQEGKYGILNYKGEKILDEKYNSIKSDEYCSEKEGYEKTGYIISEKTKNGIIYGYADYKGKIIIEPKYESISRALEYDEEDVYLIVMDNGKKGVLKNNKQIIKNKYQSINYHNLSNIFVVNKNGKYGFYNNSGKEILKPEYTNYSVVGNYISVKKDNKSMLYDLHGNLVNSQNYKSIIETDNPSYFIAQNDDGKYSIISKDIQIDEKYSNISYAFDNYFIVTDESGKTGVIDVYSGVVINLDYDYIVASDNKNVFEAKKENDVDIYSKDLKKIVTVKDGIVENIGEEYIVVYSKSEMIYINKNGEIIKNTEVYPNLKLYSFQSDDCKWGFVDDKEKIIVNCKYDIVTELNIYGFAGICQDGKWGVIDQNGNVIVVPTYKLETYYFPKFIGKYLLSESENLIQCMELEEGKK